jgi:PAS domain S-box-containing protein
MKVAGEASTVPESERERDADAKRARQLRVESVFGGPGSVREVARQLDWSSTPLGPIEGWPVSLRTAAAIVMRSPVPMILVWGPELIQLYNDAYALLIGGKHPRALGNPTHETWPELRLVQTPIFARVFSGEAVQIAEARYYLDRRVDGIPDEAFFDATFAPVPREDGSIGGSLSTLFECTTRIRNRTAERERLRLTSELTAERARLVAAQAVAQVGSWETDLATLRVIWSQETYRIFDLDPTSFTPTHPTFLDRVHPDDATRVDAAFRASFETRSVQTIEHRIVLADQTVKHVEERWSTFIDGSGVPVRAVGTCQDITARSIADSKLRRLVTAVEQLTDEAISIIDESGKFLYTNETHARILDYGSAQAGTLNIDAFMPDETALQETRRILEDVRRGRSWRGVVRRRRVRDGAVVMMDMIVGAIPEDERTLFFEILSDASDRIAREQHLRRVERLAGMGTLIAGVAHELNNPLSAVLGFTQLLLAEPRSDEERGDLETIAREARRMARIVSDLKSVARDTQQSTRLEGMDLNDVVRHVLRTREYSISTSNIELTTDLAEALPLIMGDRARIEQLLLNLVINAEQALSSGTLLPRRLSVRTRVTAQGCSLLVADNGPGIPRDQLDRIFDPFFTTRAPGGGTGLGLALVQSIVNDHRGQIRVDSEVGKGSSFRVDIPRAPTPEVEGLLLSPLPPVARRLRILVVDDEEAVRRAVARILERRGHTVHEAADGEAALAILESSTSAFDVIVTDLRMPGLSGDALLERLKLRTDGIASRVLFLTGDTENSEALRALTDAHIPFLAKPIGIGQVIQCVEQIGESNATEEE